MHLPSLHLQPEDLLSALCRCQASLQILADLEVLARADYFVGSYHSRWAQLVESLRYGLYGNDRTTSVDASVDHGDLYSIIHRMFHGKVSNAAGGHHAVPQDRVAHSAQLILNADVLQVLSGAFLLVRDRMTCTGPLGEGTTGGTARLAARLGTEDTKARWPRLCCRCG